MKKINYNAIAKNKKAWRRQANIRLSELSSLPSASVLPEKPNYTQPEAVTVRFLKHHAEHSHLIGHSQKRSAPYIVTE